MKYKFIHANETMLDSIYNIFEKRIEWMDNVGIKQWNVTNYIETFNKNYLKQQILENNLYVMINNDKNKIVGAIVLHEKDNKWEDNEEHSTYYLHNLVTDVQEKRVGIEILNAVDELARKNNKEKLRLDCAENNEFLNSYYKKAGYFFVGKIEWGSYKGNKREKVLNNNISLDGLKIDYKFNFEDFKVIENIEHKYFENDNIAPAEECEKWYEKNDLTCVGVRNSENKVIASVSVLPLKYEIYKQIYENKMNEAEINYNQIVEYQESKSYYIYLSSISIDINYRNNYKVITTLLKGCIDLFDMLAKKNILIKEVMAEASTIHGEKICKKLLKMEHIRDTSHDSKIYTVDGIEFTNIIKKLQKKFKI